MGTLAVRDRGGGGNYFSLAVGSHRGYEDRRPLALAPPAVTAWRDGRTDLQYPALPAPTMGGGVLRFGAEHQEVFEQHHQLPPWVTRAGPPPILPFDAGRRASDGATALIAAAGRVHDWLRAGGFGQEAGTSP